jgi:UDP-GlcNAc:undecaprenyl-phosphate GlcNAc-1-phosphate transferase
MDGLAAGMAALAAGFRLSFFLFDNNLAGAVLAAALIGGAIGFLVRNFPPARIFMGDAGSLFLGFLLSGLSLLPGQAYSRGTLAVLVLPVLLMVIPIFDTAFVTVTRLLTGRPIAQGGRDHTSHRLVALGITERQALAVLWGVSALAGGLALLSYRYGFTYTVVLVALLLICLVLLGVHLSRVQVARTAPGRPDTTIVRVVEDFPFKRHVATVGLDLVLILVAYYTAYLLRFEDTFEANRGGFVLSVAPVIVIQLSALALFGAYRGLWRYTGVRDLLRLLQAVTAGTAASVLYFVFVTRFEGLSRAVFVLDWLLLVLLVCGSRVSFRLLGEVFRRPPEGFRRVLIYGAGDGGELALRELRNNPDLKREPVGFVDDDRAKIRTGIHGVPVLGDLDAVEALVTTHRIDEVVIASRKIPPERLRQLQAICTAQGISLVRASVRIEYGGEFL